jgi:hypothetical protein
MRSVQIIVEFLSGCSHERQSPGVQTISTNESAIPKAGNQQAGPFTQEATMRNLLLVLVIFGSAISMGMDCGGSDPGAPQTTYGQDPESENFQQPGGH